MNLDDRLKNTVPANGELQLVQITDPHLFGDASGRLRGVASLPALRATLELARSDIAQSDAILLTGDLVQDDAAGYAHIRDCFAPLGRPVLTIAGNHDLKQSLRATLGTPPFHIDGHHDRGAWRLVMLDSSVEGRAAGELTASELTRLEAALESAGGRHVLICLHHHPISLDSRWLDQVALQNSRELFAIVDKHPAVRGIVFGHVHQAHDSLRGDVRLLGTPSTCAQFLPGSDRFQVDPRPPAYRHLLLRPNGSISTRLNWLASYASGNLSATSQNSLRA
jgi:3',5'-cyclic-AMP phosphodiesterase